MNKSDEAQLSYYNALLMLKATASTHGEINELHSAVQHWLNDQGYTFGPTYEVDRLKQDYDLLQQYASNLYNATIGKTAHHHKWAPLQRPYKAPQ